MKELKTDPELFKIKPVKRKPVPGFKYDHGAKKVVRTNRTNNIPDNVHPIRFDYENSEFESNRDDKLAQYRWYDYVIMGSIVSVLFYKIVVLNFI